MNGDEMDPNGSGDERDLELRAVLHDVVADIQPRDGLAEVRRRTRVRRTSTARRWLPVLLGSGAVAATVVVATVVVQGLDDDRPEAPPVAGTSTTPPADEPTTSAAGLYFLGESPSGPRLYREFQAVTPTTDPAQKVLFALQRLTFDVGPRDRDYWTLWPSNSFAAVRVEDDRIVVELGTEAALQPSDSSADAWLGVQQAVYTADGALLESLPLAFEWNGAPAREVLGFRVKALVDRNREFAVTAPVNVTDPTEGLVVEDGTFVANGTMSTNVRRVEWTLSLAGEVVREGAATHVDIEGPDARATLGAPGWETEEIDVSDLAPGDYVFEVTALDVGQTSDSPAEYNDTRTITVR